MALAAAGVGVSLAFDGGRSALRCVDGTLEAREGSWLGFGESAVDDPLFVPLPVPETLCHDSTFSSRSALERAYLETAVAAADAATTSLSTEELERMLAVVDLVLGAAKAEGAEAGALERRKRALLASRLRLEVGRARRTRERAWEQLEQGRRLGLDAGLLDELEHELRMPPDAASAAEPPPRRPALVRPPASTERAL